MTPLRWAAIAFIVGASLTNLVGLYKGIASIELTPRGAVYAYRPGELRARQYSRVYRNTLTYESIILLGGVAILLLRSKPSHRASRPHWAPITLILLATIVNIIHTKLAYDSRGWVPIGGVKSTGAVADRIRDIWHQHVNISGVERELVILTAGVIGMLLLRSKGRAVDAARVP